MEQYILPAVLGLVGVIAGALITSASQRKKVQAEVDKDQADANEVIRKTVMELLEPLNKKIDVQEDEISKLKVELQDWKNWAYALVEQLKSLGCHEPVPFKSSKGK